MEMKSQDHSLAEIIKSFFFSLDRLSSEHQELMDTDVRECLHLTLNHFFVWGVRADKLPSSYSMFSPEGDQAVAQLVKGFLADAELSPEFINTPTGQSRLNLLQNTEIDTPRGYGYDDFIGHADEPLPAGPLPESLFGKGAGSD